MAPLNKPRKSPKCQVKISGKRTIDQVNQDWQDTYEPNKRQRVDNTAAKSDDDDAKRPKKSCLKRKSDHSDREDDHDQPKKRVKIPKPDNPDVREISKDGDPDFDFDLNRIFKGTNGPAFKTGNDAQPKPVERRRNFGTEFKVISTIPGIGRKLAPLELLPAEVLQQILGHLLGDRTLHIELGRGWKKKFNVSATSSLDPYSPVPLADPIKQSAKRSYAVCRNPDIECLTRWHSGYVPYKQCHESCCKLTSPELHDSTFDRKLHLPILRVSPVLYREGSAMLWSTNKFAFNNAQIFTDFMKCVGPAQSIRKLELSEELVEGAFSRDQTWNRIIQQDEALLDWGLQGQKPQIMDTLKSVEHLELHFHHIDRMAARSARTEPPKYDEELHKRLCSAFGDLRALEHVRTHQTYASMQILPVTCDCVGPERFVFDEDDEAMRHSHAYRIPRVEKSFDDEIRSPLGLQVVQNEEDFREQRRQIFRLRTEVSERQASLDCDEEHLRILQKNERRARRQLLVHREDNTDRILTACRRAHDAVSHKYELAYSLAEDKLNKRAEEVEKESKSIEKLSEEAGERLVKLEKRWGRMASKGLAREIAEEDSDLSSDSD